jgi:hypothetical protein
MAAQRKDRTSTTDNQGPEVVNTGDDSDTIPGADHADEGDKTGSPDYPGTVKPTGELVTDATVEGLDQARRNANMDDAPAEPDADQ